MGAGLAGHGLRERRLVAPWYMQLRHLWGGEGQSSHLGAVSGVVLCSDVVLTNAQCCQILEFSFAFVKSMYFARVIQISVHELGSTSGVKLLVET